MSHLEALSRIPFDLGLFARAARQRLRRTLAYLFILVVLSTAATTTSLTLKLRDLVKRLEPHLDQIPTITIKNGEASADVEQPWVKRLGRDDSGHEVVAIIDTTGTLTDFRPNEIGVFLQKQALLVKTADEGQRIPLSRFPDTTIGPDIARQFLAKMMRRVPFYLAAVLVVYYLFVKSVQALLLVLAALIGASRRRALGFGALFSVAVYALTPAVLLDCSLPFMRLHLPMFWLIYGAIAVAYAVLGGQRAAAEPPDTTANL
jgi:hypothetical protein